MWFSRWLKRWKESEWRKRFSLRRSKRKKGQHSDIAMTGVPDAIFSSESAEPTQPPIFSKPASLLMASASATPEPHPTEPASLRATTEPKTGTPISFAPPMGSLAQRRKAPLQLAPIQSSPTSPTESVTNPTSSQLREFADRVHANQEIFHSFADGAWKSDGKVYGLGSKAQKYVHSVTQKEVYFKTGGASTARAILAMNYINGFCDFLQLP